MYIFYRHKTNLKRKEYTVGRERNIANKHVT